MSDTQETQDAPEPAWIVTGPTSGIGRRTALELAAHGTVILVGRSPDRLARARDEIRARTGGNALTVLADLSDVASARRAADEIAELDLPLAGLVNNAGMISAGDGRTAQGWDITYATNHLGPFAFTEALIPRLPDGAHIVFLASGVEDPERAPAVKAGYRGGRFISVEASAHGRWQPGGSAHPGYDAYATAKQCVLASALALARETPRLRISAVEPGFSPATGLVRDAPAPVRFVLRYLVAPFAPVVRYWSTPGHAGRLVASIVTDPAARTGVYYDDRGAPMSGSERAHDEAFQDRVVTETRTLLADPARSAGPTLTA
jgi:NAD(P)-dependent dehydrogenase (short-subunit alcohol dehydrogenase family)